MISEEFDLLTFYKYLFEIYMLQLFHHVLNNLSGTVFKKMQDYIYIKTDICDIT